MGFTAKQTQALQRSLSSRQSGRARRMDANSHTSKGGMRSQKPIGSSASMRGAERQWIPVVC